MELYGLVYGTCECFVMQMLYVCVRPVAVLNAAFCMTQFVNDGQGCKRRPYGRGILQSRSHDCLYLMPLIAILMYYKIGYHVYADDTQLYYTIIKGERFGSHVRPISQLC